MATIEREQNYVTLEFHHTKHAIAHWSYTTQPGLSIGPYRCNRRRRRRRLGLPVFCVGIFNRTILLLVKHDADAAQPVATYSARPTTRRCWYDDNMKPRRMVNILLWQQKSIAW